MILLVMFLPSFLKSGTKRFDFYRSDPIEKPENFKLTAVCDKFKEAKDLVDFLLYRDNEVRIHKQEPE